MDYQDIEIFDGEIDENYEPTIEEIHDYARFLGMDPIQDKELLYIAREGLKAPLPEPWKACRLRDDEICYYNPITKEYKADHPLDDYFRNVFEREKELRIQKKRQNAAPSNFKAKFAEKLIVPIGLPNQNLSGSNDNLTKTMTKSTANTLPKSDNGLTKTKNSFLKTKSIIIEGDLNGNNTSFLNNPNNTSLGGIEPIFMKTNEKDNTNTTLTKKAKQTIDNNNNNNNINLDTDLDKDIFSGTKYGKLFNSTQDNNNLDEIDDEYDKKWETFTKNKDKELENFRIDLSKKYKQKDDDYTKDINHELELIKNELNNTIQDTRLNLLKEKELTRKILIEEYDQRYQNESNKLKEENDLLLKDMEAKENSNFEIEIQNYQSKLKNEHEIKKLELLQEKKEMEIQLDKFKRDEENLKHITTKKFENEKKKIIKDYIKLYNDFENEEKIKQKEELDKYIKELQEKFQQEKDDMINKYQKRLSAEALRQQEIKESYNKKLEIDKEKLDTQLIKNIKEYEENQRIRKDAELIKLQANELKIMKEKKFLNIEKDRDEYRQNFNKRLENYKSALIDKAEVEKMSIDQQVNSLLNKYREYVKGVNTDLHTKEDTILQINKIQNDSFNFQNDIQGLEFMVQKLRNNNDNISKEFVISPKQSMYKSLGTLKQNHDKLDEIRLKITRTEAKIAIMERNHHNDREKGKLIISKDNISNIGINKVHDNPNIIDNNSIALNKLIQEVTELKSFILKKDQNEDKYKKSTIRSKSSYFKKNKMDNQSFNTLDDWKAYYIQQRNELKKLKNELHHNKLLIKKNQEYLTQEQKKFEEDYNKLKNLANKDQKRKMMKNLKEDLNSQVRKLNEDIYTLQEDEFLIKSKERILKNMKNAIDEYKSGNSDDYTELMTIYKQYKEIKVEFKSQMNKQKDTKSNTMTNFKNTPQSQKFFDKWNTILKNQLTLELDPEKNTENGIIDLKRQMSNPEITSNMHPEEFKKANDEGYNYDNLLKMLNYQLTSKLKYPNNHIAQTQMTQSSENKLKAKTVFQEHAQWLKTLKTQVNSYLYSPTYSISHSNLGKF